MKRQQLLLIIVLFLLLTACKKTHLTNDFCDCADSQSTYIVDTITLTIPNLFTPNGDVYNDFWVLKNIEKFPDSKIKVTRPGLFGGTVFESTENEMMWDGMKNKKSLKDGKYKYEIIANGQTFTGYVCIYRGLTEPKNHDCLRTCITTNINDPVIN